jgi:hypothetical protein
MVVTYQDLLGHLNHLDLLGHCLLFNHNNFIGVDIKEDTVVIAIGMVVVITMVVTIEEVAVVIVMENYFIYNQQEVANFIVFNLLLLHSMMNINLLDLQYDYLLLRDAFGYYNNFLDFDIIAV